MNTPAAPNLPATLDAARLSRELADQIRPRLRPNTHLVGLYTGGVWLAETLAEQLGLGAPGVLEISFYRDDLSERGLAVAPKPCAPGIDINDAHIILVDDILQTGRTIRAALNVLFDYGRPACVELAVLVDRGERQLPIAAQYCALTLSSPLPAQQRLKLERTAAGELHLRLAP